MSSFHATHGSAIVVRSRPDHHVAPSRRRQTRTDARPTGHADPGAATRRPATRSTGSGWRTTRPESSSPRADTRDRADSKGVRWSPGSYATTSQSTGPASPPGSRSAPRHRSWRAARRTIAPRRRRQTISSARRTRAGHRTVGSSAGGWVRLGGTSPATVITAPATGVPSGHRTVPKTRTPARARRAGATRPVHRPRARRGSARIPVHPRWRADARLHRPARRPGRPRRSSPPTT